MNHTSIQECGPAAGPRFLLVIWPFSSALQAGWHMGTSFQIDAEPHGADRVQTLILKQLVAGGDHPKAHLRIIRDEIFPLGDHFRMFMMMVTKQE